MADLEGSAPTGLDWIPQIPIEYAYEAPSLVYWGKYHPYTFTNWRDESRSWKENCYLHAGLSIGIVTSSVKGPDADKFLSAYSVSDFTTMKPYRARHIIMCADNGNIIQDGMAIKLAENEYRCYDIAPYVEYLAETSGMDVTVENITDKMFIFQLGGPRSLEVLEHAAKQDLHDLRFMRLCDAKIAGHDVQVLRMGMCGTLGYEVHGTIDASHDVYNELVEAGKPYDLHKLGTLVYVSNHTENGIAQQPAHFIEAWKDDEGFAKWAEDHFGIWFSPLAEVPTGTYTDNIEDVFKTPYELNWGKMVNFNHEFKGKAALEKVRDSHHRELVTLSWNDDDIIDVYRSQFDDGPTYKQIEQPLNYGDAGPMGNLCPAYRVEAPGGKVIGQSMWRVYTEFYHKFVSLGIIDPEYTEMGTELTVIWGEADGPQKKMRVTVDRYPYLDLPSNKDFDIESIPHYQG